MLSPRTSPVLVKIGFRFGDFDWSMLLFEEGLTFIILLCLGASSMAALRRLLYYAYYAPSNAPTAQQMAMA